MADKGNVYYAKAHFKFNARQYRLLRRHLKVLAEYPEEGWAIYGEEVNHLIEGMWLALCEVRHNRRKALGRTGEKRDTNIYRPDLQARLRKEKFDRSPYCEAPEWTNCPMAGQELSWDQAQLDHIIPVTDGGETTHENTRLACATCHAVISAKSRREKRKRQGLVPHHYGWGKEEQGLGA